MFLSQVVCDYLGVKTVKSEKKSELTCKLEDIDYELDVNAITCIRIPLVDHKTKSMEAKQIQDQNQNHILTSIDKSLLQEPQVDASDKASNVEKPKTNSSNSKPDRVPELPEGKTSSNPVPEEKAKETIMGPNVLASLSETSKKDFNDGETKDGKIQDLSFPRTDASGMQRGQDDKKQQENKETKGTQEVKKEVKQDSDEKKLPRKGSAFGSFFRRFSKT